MNRHSRRAAAKQARNRKVLQRGGGVNVHGGNIDTGGGDFFGGHKFGLDEEQTGLWITKATAPVIEGLNTQDQKIDEILNYLRASGLVQRSNEGGMSEAAIRAIVQRLGGAGVPVEGLLAWLDNWIENASRALAKKTNIELNFEVALQEAQRRFNSGQLENASSALMDEFEREERRRVRAPGSP
jgi:hypothetical protein